MRSVRRVNDSRGDLTKKFDVAVIGAGSAGAVVAARLSEDAARTVLLLEAGPDYPTLDALPPDIRIGTGAAALLGNEQHLWGYMAKATTGQEPTALPRGKLVGGCSAINNQVFIRGVPEDFDGWAAMGNDQWSFDRVLPYFKAIETDLDFDDEWHGQDGPTRVRRHPRDSWLPAQAAFAEACLAAGFPESPDQNAPRSTGIGPIAFNNVGQVRASTALTYLADARARTNLTIRSRATARRFDIHGSRVRAVDVAIDGRLETIEADTFVLAAGAIGSPHLLLLSGIGPAEQLRAHGIPVVVDVPGVGQNLMDHPVVHLIRRAAPGFIDAPELPVLQVALRYTAAGSAMRNDLKILLNTRAALPPRAPVQAGGALVALLAGLQLPFGSGELRLQSDRPEVQPAIDLRFLEEEDDRRRLRDCIRLSIELADDLRLAAVLGEPLMPSATDLASAATLDAWMQRWVKTSQHASGTCRMGPADDPGAVVDQFGSLRGIENLRVADASIFPRIPRGNLNATVLMAAERMAQFARV